MPLAPGKKITKPFTLLTHLTRFSTFKMYVNLMIAFWLDEGIFLA